MKRIIIFFASLVFFLSEMGYANNQIEDKESPVFIEYDQLFYDETKEIVIFKGQVIVVQDKEILIADEMYYERKEGKYYAVGNIAILKDDGSVYFADILNVDRFLYKGRALNFKGRLANNGLVAASEVEMFSKTNMAMGNVVFSTCKICENNLLPNIPLWQIRAKEALLDREKESITYKHATLEAFGVPIAYTPYIVTPTPGAKRKSGFLAPNFRWSNEFGNSLRVPYYWNIAPNMDATTAIRLHAKDSPLLEGEFRHLLSNGEYKLRGSIINTKKVLKDGTIIQNQKKIRGHFQIESNFNIENNIFDDTYIGLNSMRVYDKSKTYLKKYKLSDEDILTTNGYVRNFWDNNYLFLDTLYFQNLNTALTEANWKNAPRIVPWLRGHFDKEFEYNNSKIYLDLDALNLSRDTGMKYQRLSSKLGYKVPFILPYGQLINIDASIRGDYYQVNQSNSKEIDGRKPVGSTSRAYPQLDIEWRLPLVNYSKFGTFTLEPVTNIILAGNQNPSKTIPNEDSQYFEISALNLMSNNRYLGHDQLEVGSRINYGLRGNLRNKYIENFGFTVGQVINFNKHEYYGNASGLAEKRSDYVSKVYLQPTKEIYLAHKLRLNHKNFSIVRNELYTSFNLPKWSLSVNYMQIGKKILTYNDQLNKIYGKDVTGAASYNVYDSWWLGGYVKRKLGRSIPGASKKISEGVNLNYLGDCLHTFFTVERDHTKLNDLRPSTTYALSVQIPGL